MFIGFPDPYWTPLENIYGCEKLISQWHRKGERDTQPARAPTRRSKRVLAQSPLPTSQSTRRVKSSTRLVRDVTALPLEGGIASVLREGGYQMSDLAHIHCSPPCETYSRTDVTNQYRDPPCNYRVLATGEPTSRVGKHRNKAIEHDSLVNHILGLLAHARKEGGNFTFSIENPRGMLRERSFQGSQNHGLGESGCDTFSQNP